MSTSLASKMNDIYSRKVEALGFLTKYLCPHKYCGKVKKYCFFKLQSSLASQYEINFWTKTYERGMPEMCCACVYTLYFSQSNCSKAPRNLLIGHSTIGDVYYASEIPCFTKGRLTYRFFPQLVSIDAKGWVGKCLRR